VVILDSISHAARLEISVDHNDNYSLLFRRDTLELGTVEIPTQWIPERGMRVDTIDIPRAATEGGFDNLWIVPRDGDDVYSMGHVRMLQ
jgi:hypothetical protein